MHRRLLTLGAMAIALPLHAQTPEPAAGEAVVADSAFAAGTGAGAFFLLAEVDGKAVDDDARRASLRASLRAMRLMGRNMTLQRVSRPVAAGRRKLTIVAGIAFSAPLESLFRDTGKRLAATFEVDLLPGVQYAVTGVFDDFRRELWIEEVETRRLVTPRVTDDTAARSPEMAGAAFTCCNLHYDGDWISDANPVTLPMIPVGARIVVKDQGKHRANVLINGRPMRIGLDFGREQQTQQQFLDKVISREDPRPRLAGYEPAIRAAIEHGRVIPGMTREQVLMALGHPRMDFTPSLQAKRWRYNTHQDDLYTLVWGDDDRLIEVDADVEGVKALVLHEP